MTEDEDFEEPVWWSRLLHIGAHVGDLSSRPNLEELGIDEVHRVCEQAWYYSRMDFEPNILVDPRESQWRETCSLAGSTAESLMLSSATYVEAQWHRQAIAAGTEMSRMAIAQRYLADASIEATASVGHRLVNLVARVARTDPAVQESFAQAKFGRKKPFEQLGPSYQPFITEDQRAWLSLNATTITRLRSVLPTVHHKSLDALKELEASSAWKDVYAIRARNFHRWRPEHESVSGVDAGSGNVVGLYDTNNKWYGTKVSSRSRRHTAGDGLTEQSTAAAGAGLMAAARALDAVVIDTVAAARELTGVSLPVTREPGGPQQ